MNIKFNLKEYKKEIIVILIYLVIFSSLIYLYNSLSNMQENIKYDETLAKTQYDNVRNIEFSKESLEKELTVITLDVEELNQKLPNNLEYRKVNEMLAEISLNTGGLFNLGNCNVSEIKAADSYNAYQVIITSIQGEYSQIKNMLEYIKNYNSKITITQLNLSKDSTQTKGSMTLVFYGKV